jgi:Rad52/22 family double-strand break repair protein
MALTDTQVRQLRAKLDAKHVKSRQANGADLHYVEGWHVIAEANRIFGYDAWDRRTLVSNCVWSGATGAYHAAAYTAKVRVSVRAGDITIVREGSGTGEGKASTPGQAHDLALKGAETDATKRALATFGNPFGLALYDREQVGVRKARSEKASPPIGPWLLHSASGAEEASFDKPSDFADALRKAMTEAHDIELLFAIWEQNVETVRALNRSLKQDALPKSGVAPQLVNHLKQCAVSLAHRANGSHHREISDHREIMSDVRPPKGSGRKIDKSVLTISEPKRIRCKEHLRFVASQPCLICGRSPSHAHHVRYAQSRGLSLKVSDEFTVPLCAIHHHQIHATGKEREWWQERNIDPLKIASSLWQQSRERYPTVLKVDSPKSLEDRAGRRVEGAKANDDSKPVVPATGTSDTSDSVNREP